MLEIYEILKKKKTKKPYKQHGTLLQTHQDTTSQGFYPLQRVPLRFVKLSCFYFQLIKDFREQIEQKEIDKLGISTKQKKKTNRGSQHQTIGNIPTYILLINSTKTILSYFFISNSSITILILGAFTQGSQVTLVKESIFLTKLGH